jgi:hypothetical protein
MELLTHASIAANLSLLVALAPLGAGIAYAIRPTEPRLALIRPLSLAGVFAGLGGLLLGVVNVLRYIGVSSTPVDSRIVAIGMAEAFVPLFVACASLTVAWLCAALGLRRHV